MKKRIAPILLIFLIFLVPVGGYLWHRQKPEQKIGRAVDQFLEHVEHRKISIRKPDDLKNAFTEVLSDKVQLQGASPIPNEEMTLEEVIEKVSAFQAITTLCEITESERTIKVIGSKAQVYLTAEIYAASGKKYKGREIWKLIFDLELSDSWRITGLRGTKQEN